MSGRVVAFTVPGECVPWSRPRFRNGRGFNAPKYAHYHDRVAWHAKMAAGGTRIITACTVTVRVYRGIPVGWSRAKVTAAQAGVLRPFTRPDLDNYTKGIIDGITGPLLEDDGLVVAITAEKLYSAVPRVEVEVREVEEVAA